MREVPRTLEGIDSAHLRRWRSPRTGTEYPVAMRVRARDAVWRLEPLFDDQELESRASTAKIYWEGAVRVYREQGAEQGGAAGPARPNPLAPVIWNSPATGGGCDSDIVGTRPDTHIKEGKACSTS